MAKPRRRSRTSLIGALERDPGRFELFQAIRIAERASALARSDARQPPPDPIGRGVEPQRAAVQIAAGTDLSFAGHEVTRARFEPDRPPRLTQNVFGLTGSVGAMPHIFSEVVQTSLRERNFGLRDFLALFDGRLAGLFYDAFAKYRPTLEIERHPLTGSAPIDGLMRALVGMNGHSLTGRLAIADNVLIHHAGLLSRQARSAHGAERILSNSFAQPIEVEQFVGEWLPIATDERTRIGKTGLGRGAFSTLGRDAVVGQRAWSVQGRVRLHIGPLDYPAFESFLPNGRRRRQLADLAGFAIGPDLSFTQRLTLKAKSVPRLSLGGAIDRSGASRLGWNTWIGTNGPRCEPGIVDLAPSSALAPPSKAISA